MKVKELVDYGIKKLKENKIEDSYMISKILICKVISIDKNYLVLSMDNEVEKEQEELFLSFIDQIIKGMPLQYITNKQDFMGLNLYVDENVLIPQPDTETLVEEVIDICKRNNEQIEILDLCTGSGAIGISIAKNTKNTKITLSDISKNAIEIAEKNAKDNNVFGKLSIIQSDMFENINNKFNIIVSNPPYIESEIIKTLPLEVQNEPKIALDGGMDGLDFYRIIAEKAKNYLKSNGYICVEIGYNQKEKVMDLLRNFGYKNIYSKKDLSGNDRIVIANI